MDMRGFLSFPAEKEKTVWAYSKNGGHIFFVPIVLIALLFNDNAAYGIASACFVAVNSFILLY